MCPTGRSESRKLDGLNVLKCTLSLNALNLKCILTTSAPLFYTSPNCIQLSSIMTVQFSFLRPSSFFHFRPTTFSLLGRPLRSFWTVDFEPFGPSTSSPRSARRPSTHSLLDYPLWLKTVYFQSSRPSSSSPPLTVHFDPRPSTLDRTHKIPLNSKNWTGSSSKLTVLGQNGKCMKLSIDLFLFIDNKNDRGFSTKWLLFDRKTFSLTSKLPVSVETFRSSTYRPLWGPFTLSFLLNDCFKNVRYKTLIEPTLNRNLKNILSICSRTCSRTCSCSRTRTEHEQNFFRFSRTRTEQEQKLFWTPRTRTEQELKKYACSFIPDSYLDLFKYLDYYKYCWGIMLGY